MPRSTAGDASQSLSAPPRPPAATLPSISPATAVAPEAISAVVGLADHKSVELRPNELGLYPRVVVAKEQTLPISVVYPEGEPGEVLVISAEDGGKVNGGIPVQTTKLDADRVASFRFTTSQDEGVFRVTLRRGGEQTQFDFWVGAEPAVQTTHPTL